jgi:hypothetical protein
MLIYLSTGTTLPIRKWRRKEREKWRGKKEEGKYVRKEA